MTWSALSGPAKVLALAVAAALLIVAVWLAVASWRASRTVKAEQKVERTAAAAQSTTDDQIHTREVETIIREPVIINRTVEQAERIREVPAGRRLAPTLDALCLSRFYEADPICADRLPDPRASAEAVSRSATPEG